MNFTHAIEFFFEGKEVGLIDTTALRARPGKYSYEPYRGIGHYDFSMALRQSGSVECYCESGKKAVVFTVTGIDADRRLIVSKVEAVKPSGAA